MATCICHAMPNPNCRADHRDPAELIPASALAAKLAEGFATENAREYAKWSAKGQEWESDAAFWALMVATTDADKLAAAERIIADQRAHFYGCDDNRAAAVEAYLADQEAA